MPVGMRSAMRLRSRGAPGQPHPLFASFPVIFDSSYYKQILSNRMKTFEIVWFGAKRDEIPPKYPGAYLVFIW